MKVHWILEDYGNSFEIKTKTVGRELYWITTAIDRETERESKSCEPEDTASVTVTSEGFKHWTDFGGTQRG